MPQADGHFDALHDALRDELSATILAEHVEDLRQIAEAIKAETTRRAPSMYQLRALAVQVEAVANRLGKDADA